MLEETTGIRFQLLSFTHLKNFFEKLLLLSSPSFSFVACDTAAQAVLLVQILITEVWF